jgi:hypothetical protein
MLADMSGGGSAEGIEPRRRTPRRRAVAVVFTTVSAVGIGLLAAHRHGTTVGNIAASPYLVATITVVAAAGRFKIHERRGLEIAARTVVFGSGFWALGIGIEDHPLPEAAVLAVGAGLLIAAWETWATSKSFRRSDRFVTMSPTSERSAQADRRGTKTGL